MSDTVHTQATALLSGSPFGYLIGAPMVAAIDAQGLAAMETVKFIEAVGFTSSGVPPVTTAQTVTFTYTKPVTPAGAAAARPPRRESAASAEARVAVRLAAPPASLPEAVSPGGVPRP